MESPTELDPEKIAAIICGMDKAIAALEVFANCDRQTLYTRLMTLGYDHAARLSQTQRDKLIQHHCGAAPKQWPHAV